MFLFLIFVPEGLKTTVGIQHLDDLRVLVKCLEFLAHENILIGVNGFEIFHCLGVSFDHLVDLFDGDFVFLQDIVTFKNAFSQIFGRGQNAFAVVGRDGVFVLGDSGLPIPDRHVTLNK